MVLDIPQVQQGDQAGAWSWPRCEMLTMFMSEEPR